MDSFFKFVRRSQTLPDIHHQETRRHFFENQCRVLGEQISIAKAIFSDHALCPESALPELQRVVRIGETLVEGCQNEICAHKAYLRQDERTKAFEETLTEILWCISVVFFSRERSSTRNPSVLAMDEFPKAMLGAKEKYVLQNAALADKAVLLASLDIWIDKHVCSAEECGRHQGQSSGAVCLAAQIRKRIMASISKGSDPKSSLWITVQNALADEVQIGKGSFGTVFETKWLGDVYAKKEFDTHCKDFADEANALAKLNHPHIVKVFTASSESCTPCFFLMEKMPCDLRKLLNLRMKKNSTISPFSISAGIDLMLQISEAMSYMNSEGMVHRDLKAANILVEPVGDQADYCDGFVIAKLADFGLAKVKHEVTSRMTRNTGTRLWMAPEVFGAHPEDEEHLLEVFPRKADVYSFGIVCSEILTGKSPLYNVHFDIRELYKLITDPKNPLRPELPQSCPASLASLICKCWQTDPVMRPTFKEISTILRYFKGHFMMEGRIEEFQEANGRFSVDDQGVEGDDSREAQKMIKELKETIKNLNLELTKLQESKSKAVHENEAEIKQLQNEKEAEINQLQKEVDAQRFSVDEAQKIIKELKETNKNLNLQLTKLQASKSKAMHEKEAKIKQLQKEVIEVVRWHPELAQAPKVCICYQMNIRALESIGGVNSAAVWRHCVFFNIDFKMCVDQPLYFWFYFISLNSTWIVVPILNACRSWAAIGAAFAKHLGM